MNEPPDVEPLVRRYTPMVIRRCRQLLKDEDEAMDACQDVFVRLLERRGRLEASHLPQVGASWTPCVTDRASDCSGAAAR